MQSLRIDVWSDIACPWCWVGKRRLQAALEAFDHREAVTVTWRAFELDPSAPRQFPDDVDYIARLARKYRTSHTGAEKMVAQMTTTAAADGLTMRFEHIRAGNTFDAHRLLHLAHKEGKQDALKERLFAAYLEQGRAIGEPATLLSLAVEVGLDAATVQAVLDGDSFSDEVRADEETAQQQGIHGVPFFVVDGKLGFSGAQPSDVILSVLKRAWAERSADTTDTAPAQTAPAQTAPAETAPAETSVDDSSCGPLGCQTPGNP